MAGFRILEPDKFWWAMKEFYLNFFLCSLSCTQLGLDILGILLSAQLGSCLDCDKKPGFRILGTFGGR